MAALDRKAIEQYCIPGIVLMENAGLQVVKVIVDLLDKQVNGKRVVIFAGKGNNGGDGFVIARHLHNLGAAVDVLLFADPAQISGDAAINLNIWLKMGQTIVRINDGNGKSPAELAVASADILVDALYGTGFKGVVPEPAASFILLANNSGKPIVCVDIPSGVEADTGCVRGPCFKADHTVTFALPKLGLLLEPGSYYSGKLHIVDISLPAVLLKFRNYGRYLLRDELVSEWLPRRFTGAHKGDCGRVLILAGSRGMTGAACLTAQAAIRSGAGLVTLGVPEGLHDIMEIKLTEVMTVPLPETDRKTLSLEALDQIKALLDRSDVLALGPGLTVHPETVALVQKVLEDLKIPAVIDADGLNALAGQTGILSRIKAPVVLTPHPVEMARLLSITAGEVLSDRLGSVQKLAEAGGCIVLLKGSRTLITDGEEIYINATGNPGMATGGSGDVLTGVIAALLAQGLSPLRAAAAGAFVHGRAGDLALADKGVMGLIAGDFLDCLPGALNMILEGEI
jgi:NAD(P)H-hydrate epimerase